MRTRIAMLTVGLLAACATNDPSVLPERSAGMADPRVILPGFAFREGAPQRPNPWEGISRCSLPLSGRPDAKAQRAFDDGLSLLFHGWAFEAERCFHEVVRLAPEHPMGHFGRALAYLRNPDISLLHCWEAWQRRGRGSDMERAFVEVTARWLGADREPEMEVVNAAWNTQRAIVREPVLENWRDWARELAGAASSETATEWPTLAAWAMAAADSDRARELASALQLGMHHPARWIALAPDADLRQERTNETDWSPMEWQRAARRALAAGRPEQAIEHFEQSIRVYNEYAETSRCMPYQLPGLEDSRIAIAELAASLGIDGTSHIASLCAALPHPAAVASGSSLSREDRESLAERIRATPGEEAKMPLPAPSIPAAEWTLARGQGGKESLLAHRTRPVLLVFFLGFGCLHCVEQLRQLEPLAAEFEALGIDVLTIGTDQVDGIRASLLDYAETNVTPYPYPVMSDPTGEVFKAYGCWDEFDDEALHGTFLIDPAGMILFSDISAEPFMHSQQVVSDYFAK